MIYIVAYDIVFPKRLYKISKILDQYGIRIQKSFLIFELDNRSYNVLLSEIIITINNKEDKVAIYSICKKCFNTIESIGGFGTTSFISNYQIL